MDPGSAGVGVMPADSRKVGRLGCQNWYPELLGCEILGASIGFETSLSRVSTGISY